MKLMFQSLVAGWRAHSCIRRASPFVARGEYALAMPYFERALNVLRRPNISVDTSWGRSAATVALWGYSQAANRLKRRAELERMLQEWRPVYLEWMKRPLMDAEREYL